MRLRLSCTYSATAMGVFGRVSVTEEEWETAVAVASLFEMSLVTYWITHAEGEPFVRGLCRQRTINRVQQEGLLGKLYERTQALLAPAVWAPCRPMPPLSPRSLVDVLTPAVISRVFGVRVRPRHGRLRIAAPRDVPRSYLQWGPRVRALARLLVPYLSGRNPTEGMLPGPGAPLDSEDGGMPGFMHGPFATRGRGGQSFGGAGAPLGGGEQPGTLSGSLPDEQYDSLDRYYRRHAAQLSVRTEAAEDGPPVRPDSLIVGYLDSEPAPLTAMVSGQIDWFRLTVHTHDGEPRLQLARRVEPLTIPLEGEEPAGDAPLNLLLLVDSSGSMHFRTDESDPEARGEYDIVLRACYGIFQYIESLPTADAIRVACLNFSARTFESGWHPLSRLREVKRTLLSYQGSGTVLDPRCLRRTFESRPGKFLAIAITDGSLGNTEEATVEIGNIVRAGCDFTLVHVGGANAFTGAIEQLGCPVHMVTRAEDLIGTTLGIAQQRYGSAESRCRA